MSIEEIRNLVNQEKEIEEELRKTEEKRVSLLAASKEKARKILQNARNQELYDAIFESRLKEIEKKRKLTEKETSEKIEQIRKTASRNLEKTVSFIVRHVLGE